MQGEQFLLWVSIFIIFYTYFGYPLLLFLLSRIRHQKILKTSITPSVSLIISAYNEEKNISSKIENCLQLDYPEKKLEIIVASDGSSDFTNQIVKKYGKNGIILLEFPRRGKIYALNDAILYSRGEILVFSDANTHFHSQAIRELAANFANEKIGGVCGNQLEVKSQGHENILDGENIYWSYDKWLKKMESRIGSIVSADGAIYAIRKSLYKMPENTAITDDFGISTGVIEKGYRLVYDEKAIAYENTSSKIEKEFWRKVRIINRGLRGVILRKNLLNPFQYGFYSLVLFSHKILRRIIPLLLITIFITNILILNSHNVYKLMFLFQFMFYLLASISYLLRDTRFGGIKIFYLPSFYVIANMAALFAILNVIFGKKIESWTPQRNTGSN